MIKQNGPKGKTVICCKVCHLKVGVAMAVSFKTESNNFYNTPLEIESVTFQKWAWQIKKVITYKLS